MVFRRSGIRFGTAKGNILTCNDRNRIRVGRDLIKDDAVQRTLSSKDHLNQPKSSARLAMAQNAAQDRRNHPYGPLDACKAGEDLTFGIRPTGVRLLPGLQPTPRRRKLATLFVEEEG